jgi:hypothetical protein
MHIVRLASARSWNLECLCVGQRSAGQLRQLEGAPVNGGVRQDGAVILASAL